MFISGKNEKLCTYHQVIIQKNINQLFVMGVLRAQDKYFYDDDDEYAKCYSAYTPEFSLLSGNVQVDFMRVLMDS